MNFRIMGLLSLLLLQACSGGAGTVYNVVEEVAGLTIDATRRLDTHRELNLRYPNGEQTLAATLYLPNSSGPHPAVIYHWGSGQWTRQLYDDYIVKYWVENGIAVLSYDRPGVGGSGGECCRPEIEKLATNVIASVRALEQIGDIDPLQIGAYGYSQGGWVVMNAAAREPALKFMVSGVGPAVSLGEEDAYSNFTGDDDCRPSGRSDEELDALMAQVTPSGYDPRADIAAMSQPGFWFYGGLDTSIPWRQSIQVLQDIRAQTGNDITITLFPDANHNMVLHGGMCDGDGPYQNIVDPIMNWLLPQLELHHG